MEQIILLHNNHLYNDNTLTIDSYIETMLSLCSHNNTFEELYDGVSGLISIDECNNIYISFNKQNLNNGLLDDLIEKSKMTDNAEVFSMATHISSFVKNIHPIILSHIMKKSVHIQFSYITPNNINAIPYINEKLIITDILSLNEESMILERDSQLFEFFRKDMINNKDSNIIIEYSNIISFKKPLFNRFFTWKMAAQFKKKITSVLPVDNQGDTTLYTYKKTIYNTILNNFESISNHPCSPFIKVLKMEGVFDQWIDKYLFDIRSDDELSKSDYDKLLVENNCTENTLLFFTYMCAEAKNDLIKLANIELHDFEMTIMNYIISNSTGYENEQISTTIKKLILSHIMDINSSLIESGSINRKGQFDIDYKKITRINPIAGIRVNDLDIKIKLTGEFKYIKSIMR